MSGLVVPAVGVRLKDQRPSLSAPINYGPGLESLEWPGPTPVYPDIPVADLGRSAGIGLA
jgi:hypothetical protein